MKKIPFIKIFLVFFIFINISLEVVAKKAAIVIDFDTKEVLFEKNGRHENQFIGRTIYNQSAFTTTKEEILNKIITVKITNSTNFALECQI